MAVKKKSKSQQAREMAARLRHETAKEPTNREVQAALEAEGVFIKIEHINSARYWQLRRYHHGDQAVRVRCVDLLCKLQSIIGEMMAEIKATMEVEDCGNTRGHRHRRANR